MARWQDIFRTAVKSSMMAAGKTSLFCTLRKMSCHRACVGYVGATDGVYVD